MCVCTKFYTKGTVYSSVKTKKSQVSRKWTRSGQQLYLNNNCIILCIAEFLEWRRFSSLLYTVPSWHDWQCNGSFEVVLQFYWVKFNLKLNSLWMSHSLRCTAPVWTKRSIHGRWSIDWSTSVNLPRWPRSMYQDRTASCFKLSENKGTCSRGNTFFIYQS